jgi:hypothetical protein
MKDIMGYIGDCGVIAGGSVRDVVLGLKPKDYDVFFFDFNQFSKITSQRGIFDVESQEREVKSGAYLGKQYTVFNTTLQGEVVQLIWQEDFLHWNPFDDLKVNKCPKNSKNFTGKDVVDRFDYTINMMYYDHKHDTFITPQARHAIKRRQIIFNNNHQSAFSNPVAIVNHMTKRMIYLAEKLDYTIPLLTVKALFKRYGEGDHWMADILDTLEWK